ncbi:sodium channel and clathrin linker 1-like [Nannospalax galili]|uniref:sodium channel and clathrin linker 1-like n=1 Tax=Nannospalax galili TaxID=1026970 RepID=UPI0004ED67A4|nr:sodium channel and clathrin linker 1-like [Nannospalax galili]
MINDILRQHQIENFSKDSTMQNHISNGDRGDTLVNSMDDQSSLPPLTTEYDKHLEELNEQLNYHQKQMGEMKLQLETVIKENER